MNTILIIAALLILIWIIYGYFSSKVAEPKFKLLESKTGYEIREYESYLEARVKVSGPHDQALNAGFRILAGFIFGGNTTNTSIAMTAPVIERKSVSISMTAPVIEETTSNGRTVSFIMPSEFTLATLPKPNDPRIKIAKVPTHKSAVLRYSWSVSDKTVNAKKAQLLAYLKQDGIATSGAPRSARYNPPWTPPFMLRNEIIVDIK